MRWPQQQEEQEQDSYNI